MGPRPVAKAALHREALEEEDHSLMDEKYKKKSKGLHLLEGHAAKPEDLHLGSISLRFYYL
jgi:hypothetical protein